METGNACVGFEDLHVDLNVTQLDLTSAEHQSNTGSVTIVHLLNLAFSLEMIATLHSSNVFLYTLSNNSDKKNNKNSDNWDMCKHLFYYKLYRPYYGAA